MRVVIVWLLSFSLWALWAGGMGGMSFVFLFYGGIMTIPALLILTMAHWLETKFLAADRVGAAFAVGPMLGLLVLLTLYLVAPNKNNAMQGISLLLILVVLTVLVWMISLFNLKLRSQKEENA